MLKTMSLDGFDAILEKAEDLVSTLRRAGEIMEELKGMEVTLRDDGEECGHDCANHCNDGCERAPREIKWKKPRA